jgi:hypothetical protein
MTDTGLTSRLRQHSRRAGLNIGVTMALAIAVCIIGFAAIYAQLTPLLSDFVGQDSRSERPVVRAPSQDTNTDHASRTEPQPAATQPAGSASNATEAPPTAPPPTVAPAEEFTPDLQSNSGAQVNLRSSPGQADGSNPDANVLTTLPLAAPLQVIGEEQTVDGQTWLNVRTENGDEGWIISAATEPYNPNA